MRRKSAQAVSEVRWSSPRAGRAVARGRVRHVSRQLGVSQMRRGNFSAALLRPLLPARWSGYGGTGAGVVCPRMVCCSTTGTYVRTLHSAFPS